MNIAILSNSRYGLPVIQELATAFSIKSICTGDNNQDAILNFEAYCEKTNTQFTVLKKKGLEASLTSFLNDSAIDVVVVIFFPYKIPASCLTLPKFGFVNVHFGSLPQMRGADPVGEAIRQGLTESAVCIHQMTPEFDKGAILSQDKVVIPKNATYGVLMAEMTKKTTNLVRFVLKSLELNRPFKNIEQDEAQAKYYQKLTTEEHFIDWANKTAEEIARLVNSLNPNSLMGAYTRIGEWTVGVLNTSIININGDVSTYPPGAILAIDMQYGLVVLTKDGMGLRLEVVRVEEGYFAGHQLSNFGIQPGMKFENLTTSAEQNTPSVA